MLEKRSFSLSGHRTSVALEPDFWEALASIAQQEGVGLVALVVSIDARRGADEKLASALRVFALKAR
ncbi:ribbon-helix-helix domain-containing protein [Acidocella sp.]|uniref:ribbon-helix-helix domain-containing protein n=1 Tax=Acidocella sp. TaxID=50710 RepID=UPI0026036A32|nr:ribbon-helix-helix domain-containing protein [Acidocella sp.]